jgi:hypothetical protein
MRSEFKFNQALFGYDTGHHLLGASVQLPAEIRHLLAVATDLSGSAPPEGFVAAYTGLPLTGTNYYAFFCTWLAPEMPRPGCVWSHVLLIELADFAELPDLGALRSVFRRPSSKQFNEYHSPVEFRTQPLNSTVLAATRIPHANQTLEALYVSPKQSVVIAGDDAEENEDLVLALWSQQWPRLRRSFRFSTGSFADRGRGGAAFDLQVSPKANRRAWQRGGDHLLLDSVDESDRVPSANPQNWIRPALDDLLVPDSAGFRSFLHWNGADINEPRSAFARLASAYERLILRPNEDWADTLRTIGGIFPDQSEAIYLKQSLINSRGLPEANANSGRDLATVSFLLTSDDAKPYEGVPHDVSGLAESLWHSRKNEVLLLLARLIRQQERTSSTAFAAAVANAVDPSELGSISEERPELIPFLLGHCPALASRVETWRLPTYLQWRISEVLAMLPLDAKEWGKIVAAMFLAPTNVAVRDAVERSGPLAIEGAFEWLSSRNAQECLPSQIWREALGPSAADRLRNTEDSSPEQLALCAWFVRPEVARQLLRGSRRDVQRLADQPLETLPALLRLHAAFLLVALGLHIGDIEGVKLLARGFFPVYDALASNNYSSESWGLLSPELPQLGMWREWDRCKKLRRALRNKASPPAAVMLNALVKAATNPEHLALARRIYW